MSSTTKEDERLKEYEERMKEIQQKQKDDTRDLFTDWRSIFKDFGEQLLKWELEDYYIYECVKEIDEFFETYKNDTIGREVIREHQFENDLKQLERLNGINNTEIANMIVETIDMLRDEIYRRRTTQNRINPAKELSLLPRAEPWHIPPRIERKSERSKKEIELKDTLEIEIISRKPTH